MALILPRKELLHVPRKVSDENEKAKKEAMV